MHALLKAATNAVIAVSATARISFGAEPPATNRPVPVKPPTGGNHGLLYRGDKPQVMLIPLADRANVSYPFLTLPTPPVVYAANGHHKKGNAVLGAMPTESAVSF